MVDLGSRDVAMMGAVVDTRERLLKMAHTSQDKGYEAIIVQGSGTFAVESVISKKLCLAVKRTQAPNSV